ncbi:HD domain-containing protein [Anaerolentibacter hominis]|uniref:HD domain-containing protein n=1 Tax=Anaerolentibacter hominis TaxID=3079009 RepID=UPI0031B80766
MARKEELIREMIMYYNRDPKRIQHFMKVYSFARTIGILENIPEEEQEILETAAIVHDIGIRISEKKYHCSTGSYQELEGPPAARPMLERLGYGDEIIGRVCYLIGHHHTYSNIKGMDYQILVEADFLVNIYEDEMPETTIRNVRSNIFRTQAGIFLLDEMYLKPRTN